MEKNKIDKKVRVEDLTQWRWLFLDLPHLSRVDIDANKDYLIERILQDGKPIHTIWLTEKFPMEEIQGVLAKMRSIGDHTRKFWYRVFSGMY